MAQAQDIGTLSTPVRSTPARDVFRCRVCGSPQIVGAGTVEFYFGYASPIFDCAACGCRFTRHDAAAYDRLYALKSSCYSRYSEFVAAVKPLFDRGDLAALRAELEKSSRYRFVIETLAALPPAARLLEIGASRGHLTSYFILAGRDVTGVDVSPTAVAAATTAFGEHFVLAGDARIQARAPYDAIYHVGTIGCVGDPVAMTQELLRLLKPGGLLLFNAPNREACALQGQLWFDSAPPPDLVTLYRPGFWQRFAAAAQVQETVESESPQRNVVVALRRLFGRRWQRPQPMSLDRSRELSALAPSASGALWSLAERATRKLAGLTGLDRLAPAQPSEYGLFVVMRKK